MIQAYSFDKGETYSSHRADPPKVRETKRKQYASELFHLTAAEIAEEEALYVEIKRMEQNERRYRSDRDELMRAILGLDSGLVPIEHMMDESVWGVDKVSTITK
jgi:DNA methyltransferase 1-associated protein 1